MSSGRGAIIGSKAALGSNLLSLHNPFVQASI